MQGFQPTEPLGWLSLVADLIGIVGAGFAVGAWVQARRISRDLERERARQNKLVTVVLQHGAERIVLPVEIRRAELTRAEILGRIGMLPMRQKGARFSLSYLSSPEFLRRINEIASGTDDTVLTISCTSEEIEQFGPAPRQA